MKLASFALLAALAGCDAFMPHEISTTSYASLPQPVSQIAVAGTMLQAQEALVEKLANRGFALVDRKPIDNGIWLKFAGNRDFQGASTIGSVFYVWVNPAGDGATGTTVRMVGKPTVDHNEGCPSMDGTTCQKLMTYVTWGVSGHEEAVVIHGVFSELALDGVVAAPSGADKTATR
jgi:hypothetical protein